MKKINLLLIITMLVTSMAFGQRTISGVVSSIEDDETLIGATIMVKGTSIGTVTDVNGKFSLIVPEGANALTVSFVGMKSMDMDLGVSNSYLISLEPDYIELEKVVVTALGIEKQERALGYSFQDVGGDELAGSGESNVIQGLAQKAAGVNVISSGGIPGASSKVTIRGASTFTGDNQPLIIVDGVPIDNSTNSTVAGDYPFNANLSGVNYSNRAIDINPEDIESVSILKGPAAAALYGVRAGNGAIVYTTKKGKYRPGKGVNITYSLNVGVDQVNKLPDLQTTYAQGTGGGRTDEMGNPTEGVYDVADPGPDEIWGLGINQEFDGPNDDVSYGGADSWGPTVNSLGITPVDNMEEFFETSLRTANTLSMAGGNEVSTFRLSLGHTTHKGVVPNTEFTKTNVSVNASTRLSEKIMVSAGLNYVKSGGTRAQNGSNLSGVMLGLTRAPASFDLRGEGEEGWKYKSGQQRQYFIFYDNPYWTAYENPFKDQTDRVYGNFTFSYDPLEWLNLTYRGGLDNYTDQRKMFFNMGSWDPPTTTGQIEENVQRRRELYGDFLINLDRKFGSDIGASLTLGNNVNQINFQDAYSRGRNLSIPGFSNISNASDLYADEFSSTIRSTALFFDANFDWNNTIYLQVSGRNEWSSTFGSNNNSFFYPSASTSFVFTELLPMNSVLSFGKIRYGYAQAGIAPPVYSSTTYFTQPFFTDGFTDGNSFPYLGQNGFDQSSILGNADLSPELVRSHEIGLDLRFWNGRFNVDLTYYNQKSTDLLIERPIAATSGYESVFSNFGEMSNKGIEMILSANPVRIKNFDWNITVNFSKNKSEVLSLAPGVEEINIEAAFGSIGQFAIVGEQYGSFFGTKWLRDDNGALLIDPADGLPIVDPLRGNVGDPNPNWLMGLRNSFTFYGVTVSALLDIRNGGDVWCGTCARLNRLGRTELSVDREQQYVIEGVLLTGYDSDGNPLTDGAPNDVEIDAINYFQNYIGDAGGAAVEQAIYDGSWVRLRELGISYRWRVNGKIPVLQFLELSFTGRNLWLSTDYPGVDPETSLTGAGSNLNGFDYFNMPGTRSYNFGLKVGF